MKNKQQIIKQANQQKVKNFIFQYANSVSSLILIAVLFTAILAPLAAAETNLINIGNISLSGNINTSAIVVRNSITLPNNSITKENLASGASNWNLTSPSIFLNFLDYFVGIGTKTPAYILEVAGNVSLNKTIFTTPLGFVGIGIPNPLTKMEIVANDSNIYLTEVLSVTHYLNNATNGTNGISTGILFRTHDNLNQQENISLIVANLTTSTNASESSALSFFTRFQGSNLTERIRLTGEGFLGVGTFLPLSMLDVRGNLSINNTLFITNLGRIGINVSNPNRLVQIQGDTNISDVFFITGNRLGINVTNPNRVFQVQGDTNLSDVLFTTGSRVGINTTSPSTALDIQGAVNISSATSGKLLQIGSGVHGNLTMFSVDGTRWTCGVLNSGAFNCTSF